MPHHRCLTRLILCLSAGFPVVTTAQIPERFTNLQVVPDTISRAELVAQMRAFAGALGVRCSYCHAVSDGLNQPGDDFAADTKPAKLRAREMMRMVRDINAIYLSRLPERGTPPISAECSTCHGGLPRPEPLPTLLERETLTHGIDSAMVTYAALRERFFGRRAYDFGPSSLFQLAERLVLGRRHRDAIPVYNRLLQDVPNSGEALVRLGDVHVAVADTAEAIRVYQRAVAADSAGFYGTTAARRIAALRRQP